MVSQLSCSVVSLGLIYHTSGSFEIPPGTPTRLQQLLKRIIAVAPALWWMCSRNRASQMSADISVLTNESNSLLQTPGAKPPHFQYFKEYLTFVRLVS